MKGSNLKWVTARVFTILTLAPLLLLPLAEAAEYTPESLFITLFTNGEALVEYRVGINGTVSSINLPLYGNTIEDLAVINDKEELLSYKLDKTLTIDTLNSSNVTITYVTSDLLNKTGRVWTFSIDSPVDVSIMLPENSVIVDLNTTPKFIRATVSNLIVMPAGITKISYIVGALGTRDQALTSISTAERSLEELRVQGINITKADALLIEAKNAFSRGNYIDAERLATESQNTAKKIKDDAEGAKRAISDTEASLQDAANNGLNVSNAAMIFNNATMAYNNGDYENALRLAQEAKAMLAKSDNANNRDLNLYIAAGAIAAGSAIIFMYIRKRKVIREVSKPQVIEVRRVIDLDRIFLEKSYLRQEDNDALKYLAEKGGEAFESELREQLKLPKTTMWRLVRRLEREELVEIKKSGGQNLIKIRDEYTKVS